MRGSSGFFWDCPCCHGRAVTLEAVRQATPRSIINTLWQRARAGDFPQKRKCPACKLLMKEVPIINSQKTQYLDVCMSCHTIWFDTKEYEELPKNPVEEKPEEEMPLEARQLLAITEVKAMSERQPIGALSLYDTEDWPELIPAMFGLPVDCSYAEPENRPIITWVLAGIVAAVGIICLVSHKEIIKNWGLIPADYARHYGLTFITSFFLHGGILQWGANLYFLLIFGDNVEDVLEKWHYLLLIFYSAIAGAAVYTISNPASQIPYVGASAGIAGIITYYALRFPMAEIGFLAPFRFGRSYKLARQPVLIVFIGWLAIQLFIAYKQMHGSGDVNNVSALALLGGAATGFVFWLVTRRS